MKNFKMFFIILVTVLGVLPMTGCGVENATNAANSAKETVVETASDAKEQVNWWTRSTDHQTWTNPSGTRIEITERRKEGDFKIEVTYTTEDLNSYGEEERYTEDAVAIMYVDSISEELIDRLRNQ